MKFTFTAGESKRIQQVIDDTNNKDSRDEQNVKSRHFTFPSQKAIFNQSVNETKRSDAAMLSGEWSVEQSRAIAQGLVSLAREEDKLHM